MQENTSSTAYPARFVSILLHPVFVPALVFAFLIYFSPTLFFGFTPKATLSLMVVVALNTILFPLLVVLLLWRLKFIDSIHMQGDKERYGPLIASMLFYFWVFWTVHKQFPVPALAESFLLGTFLTTAGVFMATIFYKISMHAAAWGGVLSFAILCTFQHTQNALLLLIAAILLAGVAGAARLFLNAHTRQQLYSGYAVGFVMQLLAFFIVHQFLK
ncbi:MAG: hypothetical protein IT257_01985 [Chitinophagaceae bacterium]|nr:hypothetical protein [Chitinophagaceae bacterium]